MDTPDLMDGHERDDRASLFYGYGFGSRSAVEITRAEEALEHMDMVDLMVLAGLLTRTLNVAERLIVERARR